MRHRIRKDPVKAVLVAMAVLLSMATRLRCQTVEPIRAVELPSYSVRALFAPGGSKYLLVASQDGTATVYDWQEARIHSQHRFGYSYAVFRGGGGPLLLSHHLGRLHRFDLEAKREILPPFELPSRDFRRALNQSRYAATVAAIVGDRSTLRCWIEVLNFDMGKDPLEVAEGGWIFGSKAAISSAGTMIALDRNNRLEIWDVFADQLIFSSEALLDGPATGILREAEFTKEGNLILLDYSGSLSFWRKSGNRWFEQFQAERDQGISHFSLSPNGRWVAATARGKLRLYALPTLEKHLEHSAEEHFERVGFAPDGKLIFAIGQLPVMAKGGTFERNNPKKGVRELIVFRCHFP